MNKHAIGHGYRAAMSVEEFCEMHDIGRTTFFRLEKERKGPRIMKVGRRTLISAEAAAEWRARMEAETAAIEAA